MNTWTQLAMVAVTTSLITATLTTTFTIFGLKLAIKKMFPTFAMALMDATHTEPEEDDRDEFLSSVVGDNVKGQIKESENMDHDVYFV